MPDADEVDRMIAASTAARLPDDDADWSDEADGWDYEPETGGWWLWLLGIAAVLALVCGIVALARADDTRVDALLATGLDVSSSVDADETKLQVDGMVLALQSPTVQAAIRSGRHHKIGVAIYLWADHSCPLIVDWRIVASPEDAAAIAADLSTEVRAASVQAGALTDVSKAMLCGRDIIAQAPFKGDRAVLNIVSDGTDNVGGGETEAKAALQAAGINVNAVILPGAQEGPDIVAPYYQKNIVTGPTPFVITVDKPEGLLDAWRRKFVGDLS